MGIFFALVVNAQDIVEHLGALVELVDLGHLGCSNTQTLIHQTHLTAHT